MQQLKAIRRNNKAPEYATLEAYMSHCLDAGGGARFGAFDRHVASVQKDEAVILKAQRTAKEESDALDKASKEKDKK